MAEIKDPEAYFGKVVRNSEKNEFRSNDRFYEHIDSVGDSADVERELAKAKSAKESSTDSVEDLLSKADAASWLLFIENEKLYKALSQLSEKDVELLFLIYSAKLRQAEIAHHYGVSQGAIADRHKRLKKKISAFFKKAL